MEHKRKNSLKGFTLIELIVVIAIFGIIMAATLNMIQPVNNIFRKTERYAAAEGTVDNVRRTIEDNLRYANRMFVAAGPAFTNEDTFIKTKVAALRSEFLIGTTDSSPKKRVTYAKDKVYVMKIDNPENFADISAASGVNGKISLYVYENGNDTPTSESKEWLISEALYGEFGFSVSAGIDYETETKTRANRDYFLIKENDKLEYKDISVAVSDASHFDFDLDIYEKFFNSDKSKYTLCKTEAKSNVSLALTNISSGATSKQDKITYLNTATSKQEDMSVSRYMTPEIGTASNDIYIFFTRPEF